ncbi:MAG: winged helix-turn-helix transcriptional regulator [Candidatus Kerfeldbacteria bacterium]|nr:winged helix-turn-helix transcriptional regulator [Candidatus Kerfeldbacteria bacterium]
MAKPVENSTKDISIRLHKLTFLMDRLAEQTLREGADLTFAQYRMLMALQRFGAIPQNRLAAFHGLTAGAVSRKIEELVEQKLVARVQNPTNRREHILTMTKQGDARSAKAHRVLHATFAKLYGVLNQAEQEALRKTLTRLLGAIWEEGRRIWCGPRISSKKR